MTWNVHGRRWGWSALVAIAASHIASCGGAGEGGGDGGVSADAATGGDLVATISAERVGTIAAGFYAASIVALDEDTVVVARGDVSGDAFCPDCLDIDPAECPALCERTQLTVAVLDTTTGELGEPLAVREVFPKSFDHAVNQLDLARLGPDRVALTWLDCDNSSCGGLFSRQSCTAHYVVIDLEAQTVGPVATLYEDRFGLIQLVAHPTLDQVLAVTGRTYGSYGAGIRAAVFDSSGNELLPWTALGGIDALNPAAAATDVGFAIVADDRRPNDTPPVEPCAASCECAGAINVDTEIGGLYSYELSVEGGVSTHPINIGLAQDGHLEGGHYHDREVLSVVARGDELVVAGGQAIDQDAELFVGRGDTWSEPVVFDSPIPLWIAALARDDKAAWVGSEPEQGGPATVNRIVAGATSTDGQDRGAITEPVDSHVFEVAPVVTPDGVTTTFLLRGIFERGENGVDWREFDVVKVTAAW